MVAAASGPVVMSPKNGFFTGCCSWLPKASCDAVS